MQRPRLLRHSSLRPLPAAFFAGLLLQDVSPPSTDVFACSRPPGTERQLEVTLRSYAPAELLLSLSCAFPEAERGEPGSSFRATATVIWPRHVRVESRPAGGLSRPCRLGDEAPACGSGRRALLLLCGLPVGVTCRLRIVAEGPAAG